MLLIIISGLLFGLSFGVRPQEIVSTLPLFILGAASLRMKERINYLLSAFVFSLLWLVPVIIDIGGIKNFIDSNNSTISAGGLTNTPETAELIRRIVQGVYLTLGLLALFLIYYPLFFLKVKKISSNQKKRTIFFAVWLLPSFLFNLLIRTDHAGHQQVYLSALVFLASFALWKITGKRKFLFYCSLVLIVIFNLWNFYTDRDPHNLTTYTQTSFHYTDIRRNDMIYSEKTAYIRSNYEPSKTLLFAMAPMWRVTMYHLPEYKLFNINALETKDERFKLIVREGKNWSKKEKTIREQLFKVPNGINKIIFFDNDYCKFLIDNLQYVRFKSNNCLGVLDVSGGDTYEYGLKKFEKK